MATDDIDQIAAQFGQVTAPSGNELIYCGVPTGVTGTSSDGWITSGTLALMPGAATPTPSVRTVSSASSTITDADIDNWIDCTVTTTLTLGTITKSGTVLIRNNGTTIIVTVADGANTIDCDKANQQLTTQFRSMALTPFGTLSHWVLSGAEA